MNSAYLSEVTGSVHRQDGKVIRERIAYWPKGGRIHTVKDLKAAIRASDRAFGGYSAFFATSDGGCLCGKCTRDNLASIFDSIATKTNDGWRITCAGMDNEVENLQCDHCHAPIGYQNDEQ